MNRGTIKANDIFVALRPFSHDDSKNGLPADINMVYSELFDSKNPMAPTYSTDWLSYRPKRDGVPVLIVEALTRPDFDCIISGESGCFGLSFCSKNF